MIKLRLQRRGRKRRPFYHIVVADSRAPRDGRIIERLGRYDNVSEDKKITFNEDRVIHWLKIGAQPSDTVRNILKKEGILYKMHLMRWGKTEEEIDVALEEWREAKSAKEGESDTSRRERQKELLKAEEEKFRKEAEEKAAAAAKEEELKKAEEEKAKADAEEAAAEEAKEEEVAEEAPAEDVKEETSEEAPAEEEEAPAEEEVAEEAPAEETKEEEVAEEVKEEEASEEAPAEEAKEEEATEEAPAEEEKEEEAEEKSAEATGSSTDMNANEAIDHIKNSTLEELEGFVTDAEDRVTVQRAWETKQSEA